MKKSLFVIIFAMLFWQCREGGNTDQTFKSFIMENTIQSTIVALTSQYGTENLEKIEKGVNQAASHWKEEDGTESEFREFCLNSYIDDPVQLRQVFDRVSANFESIFGNYTRIVVDLRRPLELDMGEILPVDETFGAYSPFTHFADDLFASRMAFYVILNFPYYSLQEKNDHAAEWTRLDWAYARLGDVFDSRVPAAVNQGIVDASTRSDIYISEYNIYAAQLTDTTGASYFPEGMRLLSHWNLRDEIKANYGKEDAIAKQDMLYEVMKRIITQEIPKEFINSDKYRWNPYDNTLYESGNAITAIPEGDVRYGHLLDFFHAQQKADPYYSELNTYIKRSFDSDMEIPLEEVELLFNEYLSSSEVRNVAAVIKDRLGRELKPYDIWYDGFKTRTAIPSEALDQMTRSRFPDRAGMQAGLSQILVDLGFNKEKADEIASKIQVDPARGSGHAFGAELRTEKSLLRTRISPEGMDYKGYNIAIHEFGHNVEQTISLQDVDHYLLHGVPNTAFTEALAFIFQARDLELLGYADDDPQRKALNYLDNFWALNEIMAVSLVDIKTWQWMYDNQDATPSDLRDAVNRIAIEVWNTYLADVFGVSDQPILGIYSHMISYPLYLPNYAYGQIIQFQLEEYLSGRNFGDEIVRIFSQGRLSPEQWMIEAVGTGISVQPIFRAVQEALNITGHED